MFGMFRDVGMLGWVGGWAGAFGTPGLRSLRSKASLVTCGPSVFKTLRQLLVSHKGKRKHAILKNIIKDGIISTTVESMLNEATQPASLHHNCLCSQAPRASTDPRARRSTGVATL